MTVLRIILGVALLGALAVGVAAGQALAARRKDARPGFTPLALPWSWWEPAHYTRDGAPHLRRARWAAAACIALGVLLASLSR